MTVDATIHGSAVTAMSDSQVCLSAVPYGFNLGLTKAAVETKTSFCDLGGNALVVEAQLDMDGQAREAGVSIVPDCGVGPGLISNLAVLAIEQLDEAETHHNRTRPRRSGGLDHRA